MTFSSGTYNNTIADQQFIEKAGTKQTNNDLKDFEKLNPNIALYLRTVCGDVRKITKSILKSDKTVTFRFRASSDKLVKITQHYGVSICEKLRGKKNCLKQYLGPKLDFSSKPVTQDLTSPDQKKKYEVQRPSEKRIFDYCRKVYIKIK